MITEYDYIEIRVGRHYTRIPLDVDLDFAKELALRFLTDVINYKKNLVISSTNDKQGD